MRLDLLLLLSVACCELQTRAPSNDAPSVFEKNKGYPSASFFVRSSLRGTHANRLRVAGFFGFPPKRQVLCPHRPQRRRTQRPRPNSIGIRNKNKNKNTVAVQFTARHNFSHLALVRPEQILDKTNGGLASELRCILTLQQGEKT